MTRQEIEKRDQELIKKFRTIASRKKREPVPQKTPGILPVVVVLAFFILVVSGWLLFRPDPAPTVSAASVAGIPEPPSRPQTVSAPENQPVSNAGTTDIKNASSSPTAQVPAPSRETPAQKAVAQIPDILESPPVPEPNTLPSPEAPSEKDKQPLASGVRIEELITCSGVADRECIRPGTDFSLARDTEPTVWMKVISQNPPFTLTHVYYLNGKKYCEVPLLIRHPRMRTWSSITLRSSDHIGRWRVDVIDDSGATLNQIRFTVLK